MQEFNKIFDSRFDSIFSRLLDKKYRIDLSKYGFNQYSFIDEQVFIMSNVIKKISDLIILIPNVEVDSFQGLTVEYAKKCGAEVLLRGLRTSFDFEYEMQLSQTNNALYGNIKTVFLITKPEFNFISSSSVREILLNKGDISKFVPNAVCEYLNEKY